MEFTREEEEEMIAPVSPTGYYFNSSVLNICVVGVLEFELPIDDSKAITLLQHLFLPINPRFSSIMIEEKNGKKQWKKVDVNLKNHIKTPTFPPKKSPKYYEKCLDKYLSELSTQELPQTQPLWEIHVIKYPTTNSSGTVIFKIHHALGDGYSLMGALLSCLQRAENPNLPLTFPFVSTLPVNNIFNAGGGVNNNGVFKSLPKILSSIFNTVSDFSWSVVKSSFLEDDVTPIRSGDPGVESRPLSISTMSFSLKDIGIIRANLGVSVNDVITGTVFLGTRLYMQAMDEESRNANSTALILLNTRMFRGYKSIEEMIKTNSKSPWGNHFAFLHISIPKLTDNLELHPFMFGKIAQETIKKKRSSLAVYLTAALLEAVKKFRGPEEASKLVHSTLKNTSMVITNVIGPMEKMALDVQPIKGLYFMATGNPQNLTVTIVSYMGELRVAIGAEKGFIDTHKLKSFIENAFQMILKSASNIPENN
ncbi:wax ester synthase/diacylglycerol acyltransferase 4-like [Mercurialis annua]|uniref:wax ester synthase/diacylglycerol acyltransferase 4-like n=1 Tax=Mercurialis annua TaxID=3986 RepID=UPI002160316E|nr:wax ester synthase/diacylglycerol acyltransferase 4-like [Mercurialis annua]